MAGKTLENFIKLVEASDGERITKSEVLEILRSIAEPIIKAREDVLNAVSKLEEAHSGSVSKLKDGHSSSLSDVKAEVKKQLDNLVSKIQNKGLEIDKKLGELRDGKDADEKKMVQDVLAQIKMPEIKEVILDDAFEIRNKLETLPEDERPIWVKELQEQIDKLNKGLRLSGGSGGFNYNSLDIHLLDPYTPTGTIDGVNKDFTLRVTPSPAISLKVYRGGQKQQLTTDYTLSGLVVSFVIAPRVGEIIEVEHRT